MKRAYYAGFFVALLVLVLGGCTTAPKHPALESAQLPDLIPLRHLVVNKDTKFNYRISPDGRTLGWIAVKSGRCDSGSDRAGCLFDLGLGQKQGRFLILE